MGSMAFPSNCPSVFLDFYPLPTLFQTSKAPPRSPKMLQVASEKQRGYDRLVCGDLQDPRPKTSMSLGNS